MAGTVNFQQLSCTSGHQIGVAELDNTSSLNALTYDMIKLLYTQLQIWQDDDTISCVVLCAAGDKAFCAGGDVRAMYHAMQNSPPKKNQVQPFLAAYFTLEYQCDYLIHTYTKPIIVWGDGIVMGGGIGLYIGASHRVLTQHSKLAMPEITIGLYPDVGGTWFLNQLPTGIGLFLGLTGAVINASDAIDLRIADHVVRAEHKAELFEQLTHNPWRSVEENHLMVDELLANLAIDVVPAMPASQLIPYFAQIQAACVSPKLSVVYQQIMAIDGLGRWIEKAKATMQAGSPISAYICFRQVNDYHHMPLADCFRLELDLSLRCGELGEFQEGVRALLIDKTGDPQWRFNSVDHVDQSVIDQLFTSYWKPQDHPLAELGC
ncbi:enoyl-CoA hydratase [Photobacterium jeanii]|uniref:3-hydroxyisobutyryl-CoA hydrolase n=1 Tax=Photobacterium jeanii TaxID=858640 RepID=A0A178K7U8_9GAMM|nr:enoyl-CoA hydratase/isomerase family protein [Photobacterium jeanii]OAN13146.1 enoyl-CoA hydratase [Photobacterium jeanii]PST89298.1 enoyl-CoA hydratase/isomerase family protein [Photobacterium jeanii]